MPNVFTVTIPDNPAGLLTTYGAGALIRVQSSPTQGGSYGDVMTIPIVAGQIQYAAYDSTGAITDWYQIRYEAADGDPASSYSAPFQPMPLEGVYATLTDFNLFLRDSGTDPTDDVLKLFALEAASRAIDRACNRTFSTTGEATARVFTPYRREDGRYAVMIDDLSSVEDIEVEYDSLGDYSYATATTAFRPLPANGSPYTELVFDSGTSLPLVEDSVQITVPWGWDAVPQTITLACLLQASRFYHRRDAAFGIAGSPEVGGSQMRLLAKVDPDVNVMLAPYRRVWGAV